MKDIFQMPDLPTTVFRQDAQSAEVKLPPVEGRSVITWTGQAPVGERTGESVGESFGDVYIQRYSNTLEELTYLVSTLKTRLSQELAIIKVRTEASRTQRVELEKRVLSAEAGIEENMQVLLSEQVEMKQILNSMLNPTDGNDDRLKVILLTLEKHKTRIDVLRTKLKNIPK